MGSTSWSENSKSWNADGTIPVKYGIPWGAVRKAALHYLDVAKVITKLTLGGITYNIGKQATEGLVVVGQNYSSVAFFLPDDKEAMTETDGSTMSIYDYLAKLGTTDYSVVAAWDYFAKFVGETAASLLSNSNLDVSLLSYSFEQTSDSTNISLNGDADFTIVKSAQDFFYAIYNNLDAESQYNAQNSMLSEWMDIDGTVKCTFYIKLGESNAMSFPLYIGRK